MHLPPDPVFTLLDVLCRIPSWWRPPRVTGALPEHSEAAIAGYLAEHLRQCPWLEVHVEEVRPGRPNVLALDGPEEEVELLIAGHLDTVPPSAGWTLPQHSVRAGRYYALGAADTKGGIAAAIDAVERSGPTRGVALLLYCDEEYDFLGMKHFVEQHPRIRPARSLSLCGAPAEVMDGCRGLIEAEFTLVGHPGHASRPHVGRSATAAMSRVLTELGAWCRAHSQPYQTVLNVAAVHGGSLVPGTPIGQGPPSIENTANRIPDVAWALLELRAGSPEVSATRLRVELRRLVQQLNQGEEHPIELADWSVHLDMPGYASPPAPAEALIAPFAPLHGGKRANPNTTGYLDVALVAVRDGTPALCIGPRKDGAHGPDEWVELASLARYRDAMMELLAPHRIGDAHG